MSLLVLLFHLQSHHKSFCFNPRRVPEGSGSFQLFSVCLAFEQCKSLPPRAGLAGPLPSLFREDRLEPFAALTSRCQWKHGAVLKGQRTVNTTSLPMSPLSDVTGLLYNGHISFSACPSMLYIVKVKFRFTCCNKNNLIFLCYW